MSPRKEVIGDATLYLGDCMEILPTLWQAEGEQNGYAADSKTSGRLKDVVARQPHQQSPSFGIVSDPPYGIGYVSGPNSRGSISTTGKRHSVAIAGDDRPFDPSPFLLLGVCCFTGAQHFAERLPGGSYHVWNKRVGYAPLDQADGDLIWISGEKKVLRIVDMLWRGLCRQVEKDDQIEHPTQKPVALMRWCIEKAGSPRVVADPYMGSGSTGVAATQMGLRFIGCEIEPRYFDIACRRIEQAYKQRPLFEAEPAKAPEQMGIEL